jgi:ribosomal protein S18 acetylase RimI-like enzyme
MAFSDVCVTRPVGTVEWRALAGGEVAGEAHGMLRPDRRWFISIDAWTAAALSALMSAVTDDLRHDLYTVIDADDEAGLQDWSTAGFAVARREHHYLVPTATEKTRLTGAMLPAGISLVPADAVDEDGLRLLDDQLRQDVPGTDGWVNDPQKFREYTFDEQHFDPATYLVAIDDLNQAYAGLARVWTGPHRSRLGLVGVTAGYRRRGLAKALLAAVFTALCDRGIGEVAAEADAASAAANALLCGIGARRVGGSIELVRPAQQ